MDHGFSVKSFIVNSKGELLIIRRSENNPHKPGVWEIPGGRLLPGENPFEGLKRETIEETGLDIEILNPLRVHHFTRDDGQRITMMVFLCKPTSDSIVLGDEHINHEWIGVDESKSKLTECYHEEIDIFNEHFSEHPKGNA